MLIATIQTGLEAVALEEAFGTLPDMVVEAERVAAHSTAWTMPCLWVTAENFATVDDALASDPSVEKIVGSHEFATEKYYQIDWADTVDERVSTYLDQEASILKARGTAEGWWLQIRFVSRDQFETFRRVLDEREQTFELLSLVEPGEPRESFGRLTPSQRAALVAALENGYYDVPRSISTRELAEKLDISHQTLSELLRRGTETVLDAVLQRSAAHDV